MGFRSKLEGGFGWVANQLWSRSAGWQVGCLGDMSHSSWILFWRRFVYAWAIFSGLVVMVPLIKAELGLLDSAWPRMEIACTHAALEKEPGWRSDLIHVCLSLCTAFWTSLVRRLYPMRSWGWLMDLKLARAVTFSFIKLLVSWVCLWQWQSWWVCICWHSMRSSTWRHPWLLQGWYRLLKAHLHYSSRGSYWVVLFVCGL